MLAIGPVPALIIVFSLCKLEIYSTFPDGRRRPGFEAECEEWISACNNTGLVGKAWQPITEVNEDQSPDSTEAPATL